MLVGLRLGLAVGLAVALWPSFSFAAAAPPCQGTKHSARVEKALADALSSPDDDVAKAYVAFVDGLGSPDVLAAAGRIPAPFASRPRDYYLRPLANRWLRVVYSGQGYRIHDKSPTDPRTCVDEFLLGIAAPLPSKWSSEYRYFLVTAQVDNLRRGPALVGLRRVEL